MSKIKIKSNPYEKKISYFRFDESSELWVPIDAVNNANSKLISEGFTSCFFPFKVKDIVEKIVTEYEDDEEIITIKFEGTNDEFIELKSICEENEYSTKVKVEKAAKYLENAREILPDIIEIFGELKPIINDSIGEEEIASDLKRFSDASSDVIPVCVIGNYSAGKSTFINALIGNEILPSGEDPVTAKVFKIMQSESDDCASVSAYYNDKLIKILFSANGFSISEDSDDNDLTDKVQSELSSIDDQQMSSLVSRALTIINDFSANLENDPVGNMIEVKVPFNSMITQGSDTPFAIFDTPGSNSASNVKHFEVLKEAMRGMSNGIPVFISESSKLDTTDNEDLFNAIDEIDNLDARFTMIIVNKADTAALPSKGFSKVDEEKVLRLFIPKKLYSGGIYYVSSVMGLGTKIDGKFSDENSAETFESQKDKYIDPSNKYYKTLYKYDIMPEQIKNNIVTLSLKCEDKILANSGLYSVESGISTFAKKYSSYDKCTQSQDFLNSILDKTTDKLNNKKNDVEKRKNDSIDLFKKHKADLISQLDNDGDELFSESKNEYLPYMEVIASKCASYYDSSDLDEIQSNILERLRLKKGYNKLKSDRTSSQKELASNLFENSKNIFKERFDKEAFKKLSDDFNEKLKNANEDINEVKDARKEISELASNELLDMIIDSYQKATEGAKQSINSSSIDYWKEKTKVAREKLLCTVSGSRGINESEQEELSKIILEYPEIALYSNDAKEIFTIENFRKKLVLDDTVKLKLEKLAKTYNNEIAQFIDDVKTSVENDHASGFHSWIGTLLSKLKENVVSYNQILRDEQLLIDMLEGEIKQLEEKQGKLTQGSDKIEEMISWKES